MGFREFGAWFCGDVVLLSVMGLTAKMDGETEVKGRRVPCPK